MKLQSIKVSEACESKTNPRGTKFEGTEFDDLVASVKEKGVLVPVIARPNVKGLGYEIVAGNRRYRAAQLAGLKEIPARIEKLTDNEAREIQIIENLQRADVHPLEEGKSYRHLIEKSHYEIVSIAAKVGKAESYIKQRLFLTNLCEKASVAYRSGKIVDGQAVLIAKLSAGDQLLALKEITTTWIGRSVKDTKKWIEEHVYSPLERQPWLGNKEYEKAVGPCVECKPASLSLFGPVKDGACNDLRCWKRKMDAYVNYRAKKEKMTKISDEWSNPKKGALSKSEYTIIGKHDKHCLSVHPGIVAQGAGIGNVIKQICSNQKCDVHHGRDHYGLTSKEKEERKKEREKAAKEKIKKDEDLKTALAKIEWPLSEENFEALLELAFKQTGFDAWRSVCKRHELKAEKEKNSWGSSSWKYKEAVMEAAKKMDKVEKTRLIFELLIDTGGNYFREVEALGIKH